MADIIVIVALVALFALKLYFERKAIIANVRMEDMLRSIHELVNSNMELQLAVASAALRRVADLTHDPVDIAVAGQAEMKLTEHTKKHKSDPP